MENGIEYQIFIGFNDPQARGEIVTQDELAALVSDFFERNKVDFSMLWAQGGYLYEEGWYVNENSLFINIIGDENTQIMRLVRSLTMFMNQESALVVKNVVKTEFR